MPLTCTRCEGTGFLNIEQVPKGYLGRGVMTIMDWIASNLDTDCQVCDCCGDGWQWWGEPGEHYNSDDPAGMNGPYAYNGGLCECH
jgi:hypothetical protein